MIYIAVFITGFVVTIFSFALGFVMGSNQQRNFQNQSE